MVVFFKNVFNYFHHRKKIQIVQNTQSTVYTNTSLTIFRIGRIQHWDICLFTCSVCIGVFNAKHEMGHALSVRVIHKKVLRCTNTIWYQLSFYFIAMKQLILVRFINISTFRRNQAAYMYWKSFKTIKSFEMHLKKWIIFWIECRTIFRIS